MYPISKNITEFLITIGLFSSLVFVFLPFLGVGLYLTTFISFFLFFILFYKVAVADFSFHYTSILFGPLLLTAVVILSSLVSWVNGHSEIDFRDVNESMKYFQFFPYLALIRYVDGGALGFYIKKGTSLSIFIIIFVGFTQVFDMPFNSFILDSYLGSGSAHYESAKNGFRLTLTGSNPNVGAVIAFFFAFCSLNRFINEKRFLYFILTLLLVYLAIRTQSRTALISAFISIAIYFTFIIRGALVVKLTALTIFFFVLYFSFMNMDLEYIKVGIEQTKSGENKSLNVRFDNLFLALANLDKSFIFGLGPSKSQQTSVLDSEYVLILQRYGILGCIAFCGFIFQLFKLSLKDINSSTGAILFMTMVTSLGVMFTNNIFSGYQLMSFIIILAILINIKAREV